MPNVPADIFRQAAQLNLSDHRRQGNCIRLDDSLDMIVTGDIHGHRRNLARVIDYAALSRNEHRRLVLQELTHGPIDQATGHDRSVELLLRAARLKVQYPQQVLFVMANHDLAQITGGQLIKDGREVCGQFVEGVNFAFDQDPADVLAAILEFLTSLPLGILCPNRVLISHSTPAPNKTDDATVGILQRDSQPADLDRGGPVYQWVWGRGQTTEQLNGLGSQLGVEFFVLGHRKIDGGFEVFADHAIAISSDKASGCVLHFSTDVPLTGATAAQCVKQIALLA